MLLPTLLFLFLLFSYSDAQARFLYYATNNRSINPEIAKVNDGTLWRYDIASGDHYVIVKNEPAGINSLDLLDNMIYYFTSFPILLKKVKFDGSKEPEVIRNFTGELSIGTYNPITHMRIKNNKLYWNEGTNYDGCGCIKSSTLEGLFVTGTFNDLLFHEGFAILSNGTVYVSSGHFDGSVYVGSEDEDIWKIRVTNSTSDLPFAIDINEEAKKIYYGGTIPLYWSNTDGSGMELLSDTVHSGFIRYVRVDPVRKRLYWLTESRQYKTADLKGKGITTMFAFANNNSKIPPYCYGFAIGIEPKN